MYTVNVHWGDEEGAEESQVHTVNVPYHLIGV